MIPAMKTVVYQSYRSGRHDPATPRWLARCLAEAEAWAERQGFAYRFYGDEILDKAPDWFRDKAAGRTAIVTDLGRLELARDLLAADFERCIWLDADVYVARPEALSLAGDDEFLLGREVWVQSDRKGGGLQVRRNVHNAVMMFRRGNPFLTFYRDACLRIMARVEGGVPPQIIGPKLLTALHNIIGFPTIDGVAMASPLVLRDLAAGGGPARDLLHVETEAPIAAYNLCHSYVGRGVDGVRVTEDLMMRAIDALAGPADTP